MDVIFESKEKKILSESISYATDCTYTNTITLLNMGDHATYRIRDAFDSIPDIWKTVELSMLDTRKGINEEFKAEFLYIAMEHKDDTYKPLRTIIRNKNAEQTSEEKRIIFYNSMGAIREEEVVVSSLVKTSRLGYGTKTYVLDQQTGNYVSESGEIYKGMITNNGILDRVNMLSEQAEKMVVERHK